ncbi:MAG: hypothetical protein F6J95_006370 [Leptolyngbya sp. SIO1E4]|nr:hypothetical protein [Leptolyngbya sp. SIO1E4]
MAIAKPYPHGQRPFLTLDRQRLAPLPHSENSSLLTMTFTTTITTITTTIAPGGT